MYSVLVVDDEERQRQAVIDNVDWQKAGFYVVGGAENGIEALDLLEKQEPDLILTDIKMPLMSGLELAKRVREIRPATQMVILSGYDDFEYAREAMKYNIIRYLLKPVSAAELTDELCKVREQMDERFELLKNGKSNEDMQQRLKKTEFLLPLLLGSAEDLNDSLLIKTAAELEIIKRNEQAQFGVIVSKYKDENEQNLTDEHHIDFVNAIISKYASCESFFVNGRIATLIISNCDDFNSLMQLPVTELVQSSKRILNQNCTVGVSHPVNRLSLLSVAFTQAVTARRYVSDSTGNVLFIGDREHSSGDEFENIEKSVYTLEQLLKVGSKEKIADFLDEIFEQNNRESLDYLVIQILATAHRCVSVISNSQALSELFSSNPVFMNKVSFDFNNDFKNELIDLCLYARDIISRYQKRESELICDKAEQIIDSEYMNEELSLTDVSNRLSVSPNYLSALIKKTKGKNFVTLVTERRMAAASDLLLCTSMKILEISQKCGYSDQHYFSYCFKRFYGESPNKYRESNIGE